METLLSMTQTITPELRRWIIEQATTGFSPEAVLQSMLAAGWTEPVALTALEETMQGYVAQSLPQPVAVPQPDLHQAQRQVDAGDRVVDVLVSMRSPMLVVFGNLLSAQECEALIASAQPRMLRSLTVQTATGGEEMNENRTSQGMFFHRGENEVVSRIEARIARLLQWPVENGEGLQILHYQPGAEYKPHYDYFDPQESGTARILQRGGQRVGTLVMYLNEPTRGGGTTFPDVGLEVLPKRGHAVFFAYDRPHPATRTLHGGAPVLEGEKWVATKWLREKEFH